MTTYLKGWTKVMKTEVNTLSAPLKRKWFPLILIDVLKNVLVCAQLLSKLAHGTFSLCFITLLFRFFGFFRCLPFVCPKFGASKQTFRITHLSHFSTHTMYEFEIQESYPITFLSRILTHKYHINFVLFLL